MQVDGYVAKGVSFPVERRHRRRSGANATETPSAARATQPDRPADEVVASIAHEINQPLTAIMTYAAACAKSLEGIDDARLRNVSEWVEAIADQSRRTADIIAGLRSYVEHQEPRRARTTVQDLIQESMTLVADDLERQTFRLQLDLPRHRATLEIDRVQIQQVLINLLRNAGEAMADEPVELRICKLSVKCRDDFAEFKLADNGPGIPEEIREHLFDPFVTTKPTGMGMGLAICARIVRRHGGTIEAQTGHAGSVFIVRLPLRRRREWSFGKNGAAPRSLQ